VDHASISRRKRAAEALRRQIGNGGVEAREEVASRLRISAADRCDSKRVKTEADIRGGGRDAAAPNQRGKQMSYVLRLWTGVEIERDAGVEINAVERTRDCLLGRRQTVAVSADGASEDDGEPGRTVFEVVQRLSIGRGRAVALRP
jgi:hypothetical protein